MMPSKKTPVLLLVLFACLGLHAQQQPHIIYIVADDLGWADLQYAGSSYYETPNIDRLCREGMRFNHAYAAAANCAPSRACAMSGQYAPRHGIYTVNNSDRGNAKHRKLIPTANKTVLPDENVTMAEALQAGGYKTCFAGKWHLGKDPRTQGFDINIAGCHYGHPPSYFSPYKNKYLKDGPKGEYLTDRLTDEVISFIQQQQDKPEPFFLYLAYYTVHTPLKAKAKDIQKYKQKSGTPAHNNPIYAAMVGSLDENIGRLLKTLDDLQLAENCLIVFTSDNGGVYPISKQWPLRAGKGAYYEGGIREPLVVRWPNRVKAGSVTNVPVSNIDFYPTFLTAAGARKPEGKILDGVSLLPILTGSAALPERPLFWHFPIYLSAGNEQTKDPLFRTRPGSAVRLGEWKLIEYFEDGTLELYNLQDDQSEIHNLAQEKPSKTQQLHQLLKDWRQKIKAPIPDEPNPKYDATVEMEAIENKMPK